MNKMTLADYDATLDDLRGKKAEEERSAAKIPARRAELALAAAQGVGSALQDLRALDDEEAALAKSLRNIAAAIDRARELREPLAEENRLQLKRKRYERTEQMVAEHVAGPAAAVDAAARAFVEALNQRKQSIDAIKAMNVLGEKFGLFDPSNIEQALVAAGLGKLHPQLLVLRSPVSYADLDKERLRLPAFHLWVEMA